MKNYLKKIFCVLVFIILAVILTYNITIIVKTIREPNQTPSFLGIKTYIIVSGSMEPDYNIGDMVIVKEVEESKLKVGDIISYRDGQNVVTHRIVKKNTVNGEIQYVTKGDHNNVEDHIILTMDSIEGKVIGKLTYMGKIVLFMRNKFTMILLAVAFFLYFIKKELTANDNEDGKVNT